MTRILSLGFGLSAVVLVMGCSSGNSATSGSGGIGNSAGSGNIAGTQSSAGNGNTSGNGNAGGATGVGGSTGTCSGNCSNAAAGACSSPQVRITQFNAGSAISFGTDETGVMPLAIAAMPGGGSRVAWITGYATNGSSTVRFRGLEQCDYSGCTCNALLGLVMRFGC